MMVAGFAKLGLAAVFALTAFAVRRYAQADQVPLSLELQEPSLEFSVECDGTSTDVVVDKSVMLKTNRGEVEFVVRAKPSRLLKTASVSIRYPINYAFEAVQHDDYVSWVLDGNDVVISLFRYTNPMDANDAVNKFVTGTVKLLGLRNCKTSETSVVLGSHKFDGTRIDMTIAGTALAQEVFAFTTGRITHLFMFQDSLDDDGSSSDEHDAAIQCVAQSFLVHQE